MHAVERNLRAVPVCDDVMEFCLMMRDALFAELIRRKVIRDEALTEREQLASCEFAESLAALIVNARCEEEQAGD